MARKIVDTLTQNRRKCDFFAKIDAENVIFSGFLAPKM